MTDTVEALQCPFPMPLPDSWRALRLGQCVRSVTDGDWIETKDQGGSDYRLLQVSNIAVGAFRETGNFRYITQETFDRLRCHKIHPGSVLVARMPDPVGRAWHVRDLAEPAITAVDVAIIETEPEVLVPEYLAYYLNSPFNLSHSAIRSSGTTRARITRRDLETFPIPVPPIAVQKRIALLLGNFDRLGDVNKRRIETLEETARLMYREWFVHFRFPGQENVDFIESDFGPIPEGWDVGEVGDVVRLQRGFDLPVDHRNTAGDVPVLAASGIHGCHDEAKVAGPGVSTGRSGTIGPVTYVQEDFWPLNTVLWVKEYRRSSPVHAYFFLESLDLMGLSGGAAVPTLNRNHVHARKVPVPPQRVVREYDAVAAPMFELRTTLNRQNKILAATRDVLLPRLISGELDVSGLDLNLEPVA